MVGARVTQLVFGINCGDWVSLELTRVGVLYTISMVWFCSRWAGYGSSAVDTGVIVTVMTILDGVARYGFSVL